MKNHWQILQERGYFPGCTQDKEFMEAFVAAAREFHEERRKQKESK